MRSRLPPILLLLVALAANPVRAEEQYRAFVQALRDRNYFDNALVYLEQLSQRSTVPDDVRQMITYERAITLRESARQTRNPEKQSEQLDQALGMLERFSRESPEHALNADANLDRAQILMQKADVEITQSKSPALKGAKGDYQKKGREYVAQARDVLKRAYEQHEAAFRKFPAFVDEQKEPRVHAERAKVERSLLLESLNLAKCTYHEAQTWDSSTKEFKTLLRDAAAEFEKTHQKYRNQVGGLHARAWQGKCFEELGDRQQALGIYNELLEHPGDETNLQNLKSQVLLFKFICLHSAGDDQSIVDLSEEWLKKNPTEARTAIGLGMQWQQARALEALGDSKNLPKADQERHWRQARTVAQQINRYPSEFKDLSLALMQRMNTKLGGTERKAQDFDTAFGQGRQFFNSAEEIKKELDSIAKSPTSREEIARLTKNWTNELQEAARSFELALTMVNRRDKPKDVAAARLMIAHTYYYLRRNYEAAILAQHVARTAPDDEDEVAAEAAYMALAALVQAFNDNKLDAEKKTDDIALIIKATNQITTRWSDSSRANDARMVLGRIYTAARQPVEAVAWFNQIPQSDPKFAEAQLAAGQAYWIAYGAAARLPDASRPNPEKLTEWKLAAEQYLRTGIEKLTAALPAEAAMPQELASARIYLAEILLSQGQDADAAKMLSADPHSVVKAVAVDDESNRPEKGIQSRSVAKSVYMLLLRADIGMGLEKLNDARAAMQELEKIVAGDAGSDLTDLYVGLGRMLKSELERFRDNGETARLNKLTAAFESFLGDMFKKQDGQTLGSLSWIGEAYSALGEITANRGKTTGYYERAAAAFGEVLKRAETDSKFATPDQLLNVKVRMIRSLRLEKDFAGAEKLLTEVLKARGNDLRAQIEAASVYQDWGVSDDAKKLILAITGRKDLDLWGWVGISKAVQRVKNYTEQPELVETYLDARYGVSYCRYHHSKSLAPKEKQKALDLCAMELIGTAAMMKSSSEDKRSRLNALYREVLRDAGKPVTDLPQPEEPVAEKPRNGSRPDEGSEPNRHDGKTSEAPETNTPAATNSSPPTVAADNSETISLIVFLVCLFGGAGVAGWMVMRGRGKSTVSGKPASRSMAPGQFSGIAFGSTSSPAGIALPIGEQKPRPKPQKKPPGKSSDTQSRLPGSLPPISGQPVPDDDGPPRPAWLKNRPPAPPDQK